MINYLKAHIVGKEEMFLKNGARGLVLLVVIFVIRALLSSLHVLTAGTYSAFNSAIILVAGIVTVLFFVSGTLLIFTEGSESDEETVEAP